jgi:hypothetical protein
MDWSRRFDDPIKTPDGRTIKTLKEAADHALSLPENVANTLPWQRAADQLHTAAGLLSVSHT